MPIDQGVFDGALVTLVVGGTGLVVAFGREFATGDPVVWTSPDGSAWTRQAEPRDVFGGGAPDTAVATPSGFVALGWGPDPARRHRDVWTSPDGFHWSRDPYAGGRLGDGELAFAMSGGVLVAAGSVDGADVLLRSTDGTHWLDVSEQGPAGTRSMRVVATDDGFLALGGDEHQLTTWRSVDGIDWQAAGSLSEAWAGAVAEGAGGLAMIGEDNTSGTTTPATWTSTDGTTWEQVPDIGSGRFDDTERAVLRPVAGGLIGLAWATADDGETEEPAVVVTRDRKAWTRPDFPVPGLAVGSWRRMSTVIDGALYVMGYDGATGTYRAFMARLGGDSAKPGASPAPRATPGPPAEIAIAGDLGLVWQPVAASSVLDGELAQASLAALGRRVVLMGQTSHGSLAAAVSVDGGLHWQLAPRQPALANGLVRRLVAIDGRFYALGARFDPNLDEGSEATIWTSRDGLRWTRTDVGSGFVEDLAAADGQMVAVGRVSDQQERGVAWTSPDGRTWSEPYPADGVELASVAAGGPGWIAGGATDRHASVWTSPDARTWSRVADEQAWIVAGADSFGQGTVRRIVPTANGFIAIGGVGQPVWAEGVGAVFASPDGLTWRRVTDGLDALVAVPTALAATPDGLVFVTSDPASDQTASAWSSVDGQAWTPADRLDLGGGRPAAASISDVAWAGDRLLAVGSLRGTPTLFVGAARGTVLPDAVCPAGPLSLASFAALSAASRLACLGDDPLAVRAWVTWFEPECGSTDPSGASSRMPPGDTSCTGEARLSASPDGPWLLSLQPSDAQAAKLARGGWFRLRLEQGVVGDPCRVVGAPNDPTPVLEPIAWREFECASTLHLMGVSRVR